MIFNTTDNTDNTIMATIKDQLKGGISAMFGETSEIAPEAKQITEEEYQDLEVQQTERRKFKTGRRSNDDTRIPSSQTDMRTSIIVAPYRLCAEVPGYTFNPLSKIVNSLMSNPIPLFVVIIIRWLMNKG